MKEKIIKILKSHSYHHTEGVGVKSQFKYLAEVAFECCADEIMLALDQSQFTSDEAEEFINQEVERRIKAAIEMNIPAMVIAPKGWLFRNAKGKDMADEALFKERFNVQHTLD